MLEPVPGSDDGQRLVQRLTGSPLTAEAAVVSDEKARHGELRRRLRMKQDKVADEDKMKGDEGNVKHEWNAVGGLRHAATLIAKVLA